MNLMRYTIIDNHGGVSFVAHGDAAAALVAACSKNPRTLGELLQKTEAYYRSLKEYVLNGLAVFDEHNGPVHYLAIHAALSLCAPHELPVFRVVDDLTREASLRAAKAGVIIFNLEARRIVQVMNSYREITREGKGRFYDGQRLTGHFYEYRLAADWSLVP